MAEYFIADRHNIILLMGATIALLAAVVPVVLKRLHISPPIVYLLLGIAIYFVFGDYEVKPLEQLREIRYITEFVVLVALANAGLRIQQPFRWKTWRYSFRLLLFAMPITIVAAFWLGWWIIGLTPATAMLFGALIAPTDPVLASELQTSEPGEEDTSKIKLGLTSEAGINDGLAFPFTYFAILFFENGPDYSSWIGEWLLHFVLLKIVIGVAAGLVSGWLLYKLVFSISNKNTIGRISRGILSLSLILLPYAISEILGGYGFLAVFFAACIFSNYEKDAEHMNNLHDFNEELESFVVAFIFLACGVFIAMHYTLLLNWRIIIIALLMVLVVRPLAGYLSLINTKLSSFQRFALSFYGMRGIGSMFYLAYALTEAKFEDPKKLIAITAATILLSVIIHGVTARSIQKRIKKYDLQPGDEKR